MVAKKKKKRKLKLKMRNVLILLTVILIFVGVIYYILQLPINNIYITGNNILSDAEVIDWAKVDSYPSFLLTSSSEVENNLSDNPYIENVDVNKKLGNKIEINVTEYKTIALINQGSQVLLSSGDIVSNDYELSDVPILCNSVSDEIFNDFVNKFAKINRNVLRQISQIEYSPVDVDNMRFLLYMDDGNLVYITLTKINKINKYNDIKDKLENKIGTIYLDSGDYVEVRGDRGAVNNSSSGTSSTESNNNQNSVDSNQQTTDTTNNQDNNDSNVTTNGNTVSSDINNTSSNEDN